MIKAIRKVQPSNGNTHLKCSCCDYSAVKEVQIEDGRNLAFCAKHYVPIKVGLVLFGQEV